MHNFSPNATHWARNKHQRQGGFAILKSTPQCSVPLITSAEYNYQNILRFFSFSCKHWIPKANGKTIALINIANKISKGILVDELSRWVAHLCCAILKLLLFLEHLSRSHVPRSAVLRQTNSIIVKLPNSDQRSLHMWQRHTPRWEISVVGASNSCLPQQLCNPR